MHDSGFAAQSILGDYLLMSGLISEARTEGAHFHTSHSVLHFLILLYLENLLLYFSFFKLGIGLIRFNTVQEQLGATQRGVSELIYNPN